MLLKRKKRKNVVVSCPSKCSFAIALAPRWFATATRQRMAGQANTLAGKAYNKSIFLILIDMTDMASSATIITNIK